MMITHICGKPEIDDDIPDIFYEDRECQECLRIRDAIIREQLKDMRRDNTYEHVMRELDHEILLNNSYRHYQRGADVAVAEPKTKLTTYSVTDADIATMKEQFMPLTINGVNDSGGAKAVHSARMKVKNIRCDIEKRRKELKADALAWGKRVDTEAKTLTDQLAPIELHLSSQEDAYEAEKERIKQAERERLEAIERAKREAEEARLKAIRDAEEAKLQAEQAAEREKIRLEREKLAEEQRQLNAERQKIESAKQRLAEAEAAHLREVEFENKRRQTLIEAERVRVEAEKQANAEKEARIAREAKATEEKAKAEEAARIRAEELKPDREKLLTVADAIASLSIPEVSIKSANAASRVQSVLADACHQIHQIINSLS